MTLTRFTSFAGTIAALLSTPTGINAQWWKGVKDNIEGTFSATCESSVPNQAGKVVFSIHLSDSPDAYVSVDWGTDASGRYGGGGRVVMAADGTASGDLFMRKAGDGTPFGTGLWFGRFTRASDGSIRAQGSINPDGEKPYGCRGTWTASKGPDPVRDRTPITVQNPTGNVCADYLQRIQSSQQQLDQTKKDVRKSLDENRDKLGELNAIITARKEGRRLDYDDVHDIEASWASQAANDFDALQDKPIADLEAMRATAVQAIEEARKKDKQFDADRRAYYQLRAEARAAGCDVSKDDPLDVYLAGGKPDVLHAASVQGSVTMSKRGGTLPLRDGNDVRLEPDDPVTIRTGKESSAMIEIGGVRKTLPPNTELQVFPRADGTPDFLEQGAATFDVRQPAPTQVETPTATVNVDGTIFTVSYNARTQRTGIGVEEGRVTVYPTNGNLPTVTLTAGQYVEVTMDAVSRVLDAPGTAVAVAQPRPARRPPVIVKPNPQVNTQGVDLTGLWIDDTGRLGIYRVRQQGNQFYWAVDGTPKGSYANVAVGTISGNVINAQWIDLPGSPSLGGGRFTLRIESSNRIVKESTQAGNYAAQVWTRQGSAQGASPADVSVWQYMIYAQADWRGTMTRRGSTNVYDVQLYDTYKNPLAFVEEVTFQGNRVYTKRLQGPDNTICTAEGTLQPDGFTYVATSTCVGGPSGWMWQIKPAGK